MQRLKCSFQRMGKDCVYFTSEDEPFSMYTVRMLSVRMLILGAMLKRVTVGGRCGSVNVFPSALHVQNEFETDVGE